MRLRTVSAGMLLSLALPAGATTYTIASGASTSTIQSTINTATSSPGNTVAFAAAAYSLTSTISISCTNGTIITGPNVGTVTQSHLPTALLTETTSTNYAFSVSGNSSLTTPGSGCTFEYLRFTGTQGGIYVHYPASGLLIQQNSFDANNPPWVSGGSGNSKASIFVSSGGAGCLTSGCGITYSSILWNAFFNNCLNIRNVAYPDSGGYCASTWLDGYNSNVTWSNNTVNGTEEGVKFAYKNGSKTYSYNFDLENNNFQGNSRILIESQHNTNGSAVFSHNSFYQPYNPSFNTFELSLPLYQCNTGGCAQGYSPATVANDNVFIGNVPVTISGSGAHYGIGLEQWGIGAIAHYNLFQGGNGASNCPGVANGACSGWGVEIGEAFTNATDTNNYFSGTDTWNGTANSVGKAVTYEDGASSGNSGLSIIPIRWSKAARP